MQIAIFGSTARGSFDHSSDFDVIAIVKDVVGLDKAGLQLQLNALVGREVGLSIYSEDRLRALWAQGSPFAWHLHLQAKPFPGFESRFLNDWGLPMPYGSAEEDCRMMSSIIRSVGERLSEKAPRCECYEAGLLYVGARNVGMFASQRLAGNFDFSRMAPYALQHVVPFPIGPNEFNDLVRARHATTRGQWCPR